jgi:cysteine desulfurase
MGVEPALAQGALRISLGWETRESDVEKLLKCWTGVVSSLLKKQPNMAA